MVVASVLVVLVLAVVLAAALIYAPHLALFGQKRFLLFLRLGRLLDFLLVLQVSITLKVPLLYWFISFITMFCFA